MHPNAPKCIRVHPNASERIQTRPNAYERNRTRPNASENFEKFEKTWKIEDLGNVGTFESLKFAGGISGPDVGESPEVN